MQQFLCIGRLVDNPEAKTNPKNKEAIATFRIAINDRNNTDFFSFEAFGKTAEFVLKYFGKGKPICVKAKVKEKKWETDSGENRSRFVFYVDEVSFVPESRTANDGGNSGGGSNYSPSDDDDSDDYDTDIPF